MKTENAQEVPPQQQASGEEEGWGDFLLDKSDLWDSEEEIPSGHPEYQYVPLQHERISAVFETDPEHVRSRIPAVKAASDPLLEAAKPLLRAISEMPREMNDLRHAVSLREILKREINYFTMLCDEVNIPWKKMAIVRYCLCTALDEAAHSTRWGTETGWSQNNLLNYFENDNDGGTKFFLLIGRIAMSPAEYIDVIGILLRILGLGFEGRYSIQHDGERQLIKIRQRLLTLLQSHRRQQALPAIMGILPEYPPVSRRRWHLPLRTTLIISGAILAISWLNDSYRLFVARQPLLAAIRALYPVPAPELFPFPRLRLSLLLQPEIRQQLLTVSENDQQSHVVLSSDHTFESGSARLSPAMSEVISRVATQINQVNGSVRVIGHTDSIPVRQGAIKDNAMLSSLRARAVADVLIASGIPADRVSVQGMAAGQPIASNATAAGRSANRRVELFVTY